MEAVEYFEVLRNAYERIMNDLDRLNEMKASATSCGSFRYSDMPKGVSDDDKLSAAVAEYVDFSKRLTKRIEEFQMSRAVAVQKIEQLQEPLQVQMLKMVYTEFKTVKEAARQIGISESYAWLIKRKALNNFERKCL